MVRAELPAAATERLQFMALAYRALARVLSAEHLGRNSFEEAAACLDALEWTDASAAVLRAAHAFAAAPDDAQGQHSRIFHRSLPPPYETSYTTGGSVGDLADIAGFYRAFGMRVEGEKPDHVAAELEFLSYLIVKELHALSSDAPDRAAVAREARAKFVTEHVGTWLPLFVGQIHRASPGAVYVESARAAHAAIEAGARELGVTLHAPVPRVDGDVAPPGPRLADREPCAPGDDATEQPPGY